MYLDSVSHKNITGFEAQIGRGTGSEFQAFGGLLAGTILQTIEPRLIVQSWRSASFTERDPDSLVILAFSDEGEFGRIDLIHVDFPDHDLDGVTRGWDEKYFEPWRAYLEAR